MSRQVKPQETDNYLWSLAERLDVERLLVERYGVMNLTEDGDWFQFSCPLPFGMHSRGDRVASAGVTTDGRRFNCFLCGGGDIGWFIEHMEPRKDDGSYISRAEVISVMRQYLREFDPEAVVQKMKVSRNHDVWGVDSNTLDRIAEDVWNWSKFYTPYWETRGFTQETVTRWQLGYDSNANRAIVPHYFMGKVVGWQGRSIPPNEVPPKWKNSPSFPKKETLFNYDQAKTFPTTIVVEAAVSAIWLWQCGVPYVVSTFGAKVSKEQIRLLKHFDCVVLWMDPDKAGWKGTVDLIDGLKGHTQVWVVDSWQGDPNDLTQEQIHDMLFNRAMHPGYMFDNVLKSRISRVDYDAIDKVRRG